ncbi:MAG: beta-lactam binding protein AmpH [Paenibacillaceae bacterium]|nr:beta-lactam binding protein AmpH [Paenibacillaceae bacterium]
MTTVNISGQHWMIDGQITCPGTAAEGQLPNIRMVNASFQDERRPQFVPDEITDRFIAKIPNYRAQGALAFTLGLQGGFPGYEHAVNTAFLPDGTLRKTYLERIKRIIRACDEQKMIVLLSLYYQRQDQHLRDEEAVRSGVAEVCRWLRISGFSNVLLEIANEYGHPGFTHHILRDPGGIAELIRISKQEAPQLLVSSSSLGHGRAHPSVAEAGDFVTLHFNETALKEIPLRVRAAANYGKPVLCNEDDKTGQPGAAAQHAAVTNGCSWGYMNMGRNQVAPFQFDGEADDTEVYAEMRRLALKQAHPS